MLAVACAYCMAQRAMMQVADGCVIGSLWVSTVYFHGSAAVWLPELIVAQAVFLKD